MKTIPIAVLTAGLAGCVMFHAGDTELRERGTRFERALSKAPRELAACIQGNSQGRAEIHARRRDTTEVHVRDKENKLAALYELTHKDPGTRAVGWIDARDMTAAQSAFDRALQGC